MILCIGRSIADNANFPQTLHLPRPRLPKLRKAQAGCGFALGGEELLHQALLVLFQGLDLFGLQPDHLIKGGEAVGDFLLFVPLRWKRNPNQS